MYILKKIKNVAVSITKKGKKQSFEKIAYEWLDYKKSQIKQSSYYNYKFGVEKYLTPFFGDKDIRKMHDFSIFIDELSTSLSPKTVRDIVIIFKSILCFYEENYNKKLRYKKIILPKIDKREIEIFTSREKSKLEDYCLQHESLKEVGIIVALNTGIRLGELCALKWENIDIREKSIYIRQTIQRVYKGKGEKSKVIIGLPKTKCSIREIPINSKLYNILRPLKKAYKNDAFFLTGSATNYIEPRNFQNYFKKVLVKCKIKEHNFHVTRHTFASNCIEVRNGH